MKKAKITKAWIKRLSKTYALYSKLVKKKPNCSCIVYSLI